MAYGFYGAWGRVPNSSAPGFFPLKVGGGGYVTAIRISGDGNTRLVRTDTYGAYRWNPGTNYWDNYHAEGKFPSNQFLPNWASGCAEIAIAPSNSSIVYSYAFWINKSTDGGVTWSECTGFSSFANVFTDPNHQGGVRMVGPKMAVHPTNPNIMAVMTVDDSGAGGTGGLYYTTDGGTTFTKETTVPAPLNQRSGTVTFDASGNLYVTSSGNGFYKGPVGGPFTQITGGPGAANFMQTKMAADGTFYLTTNAFVDYPSSAWRYVPGSPGTWTNITPSGTSQPQCIVCDPNNSQRLLIGDGGARFFFTTSASTVTSSTWTQVAVPSRVAGTGEPGWLATTNEGFLAEGDAQFDPVVANRLWLAEGIGVWYADLGTAGIPSTITYQSQNRGIEGMVATQVRATPNGALVTSQWDRAIFKLDASNPDSYPANQIIDTSVSINHGWFVDWASGNPDFMVAYLEKTHGSASSDRGLQKSSDAGASWTAINPPPAPSIFGNTIGGCIVAASTTNYLLQPQWNSDLWYTKDGGSSWTKVVIAGVPSSNGTEGVQSSVETGWGFSSSGGGVRHHAVCADRGTPGTFYAMNTGGGSDASYAGVYRSTDGGTTWTKRFAGNLTNYVHDFWNVHIEAVPKITSVDTTGHVFYTSGQSGSFNFTTRLASSNPDTTAQFKFSLDGAATWNAVPNIYEVYAFGFGKEGIGKDYPTVFIVGWKYNGSTYVYGIYKAEANYSDWVANSVTWQFLEDFPYGWGDVINTMDGDKLIRGRFYMGFSGSSYAYGNT